MNEKLLAKERARLEANELISSLSGPPPKPAPPPAPKAEAPKPAPSRQIAHPAKAAAKPVSAALPGSLSFIRPVEKEEAKSKRTTIAVRPSVYEKALSKCERLGLSFNEVVNQFLDEFTQ